MGTQAQGPPGLRPPRGRCLLQSCEDAAGGGPAGSGLNHWSLTVSVPSCPPPHGGRLPPRHLRGFHEEQVRSERGEDLGQLSRAGYSCRAGHLACCPPVHFTRVFEALLQRQKPSFLPLEGLVSVNRVRGRKGHSRQREQLVQRLGEKEELSGPWRVCTGASLAGCVGAGGWWKGRSERDPESTRDEEDLAQDPGGPWGAINRTFSRSLHHRRSPWRQSRRTAWRRGAGAGLLCQGNVTGPEERQGQWLKEQRTGSGNIKKPGCQGSGLRLPGFKSQLLHSLPVRPAVAWPVCFSFFSEREVVKGSVSLDRTERSCCYRCRSWGWWC